MVRIHCMLILFLCFILSPYAATAAANNPTPTELVDEVCNQTSNYTFCVEALYSDPGTPDADAYELAYISFGLTYLNATTTKDHIARLLKNSSVVSSAARSRLKICQHDYRKAVSALEEAFNDLNAETYFDLAKLAGRTGAAADDCQSAFKGIDFSPLAAMNAGLKALSNICVAVSKLFTGGN